MADLRKVSYRGRVYKVKSLRPGKKTIHVKSYCRKKPPTVAERFLAYRNDDMPF